MTAFNRRQFLQSMTAAGLAGVGLTLAGCGGEDAAETAEVAAPAPEPEPDPGFSCMDTSGLAEADIVMRDTLLYTDTSTTEGQNCLNCILYVEAAEGVDCGTCQTVKGPIHPEGWCNIWAAKV